MPTVNIARRLPSRVLAAVLATAVPAVAVPAIAADDVVLMPARVSEHVWYFRGESGAASAANKGFMSNAGFVVTADGVVVFDALGTPALGRAMATAIGRVTKAPIRRVVVSHYHADHIYGLEALHRPGVEIWAHRKAEIYLANAATVAASMITGVITDPAKFV